MSIYADLHVHTTHSDGQLTLADIPAAAKAAGVHVVAITDHDRIHPGLSEKLETRDGVTVIRGIELRVKPEGLDERVDLLGYGVVPTDALTSEIDRLQSDRIERANATIDAVNDELGLVLDLEPDVGVGRPHIARAIDANEHTDHDYDSAFSDVIGRGCPAYEQRSVTSFATGVELLSEACDVVGLAHPYRYADPEGALALTEQLDAVEAHYPYSTRPSSARALREAMDMYELLPTGGSDAHDMRLGLAGLIEGHYDMLEARLTT